MNQPDLIPKPKKNWRMKAPRKAAVYLRAELAEAREAYRSTPRWWRLFNRIRARVVETDPETAAAMPRMENLTDGT